MPASRDWSSHQPSSTLSQPPALLALTVDGRSSGSGTGSAPPRAANSSSNTLAHPNWASVKLRSHTMSSPSASLEQVHERDARLVLGRVRAGGHSAPSAVISAGQRRNWVSKRPNYPAGSWQPHDSRRSLPHVRGGAIVGGVGAADVLRRLRTQRLLRRALRPAARRGVAVATCHNEVSARLIAGRLDDAGIKSFVFVENPGTSALPMPGPAYVIVRPEDEQAAREALD